MPGTGGSTLLAATTLQGDDTGPVSEKHSGPGQADVSLSCLQDSSQTCPQSLICQNKTDSGLSPKGAGSTSIRTVPWAQCSPVITDVVNLIFCTSY